MELKKENIGPGQHGQRRKKLSDYALQLREKQKAKETYGVLENQFKRYFHLAEKKKGVTGSNLLQLLELRMDNAVYRLGFAANRRQARQLVLHRHFTVNNRRVSIPSYQLRAGDIIGLKESSIKLNVIEENISKIEHRGLPAWIEMDTKQPQRENIACP